MALMPPDEPTRVQDPAELAELIDSLASSPDTNTSSIGQELEALESIYPGSILLTSSSSTSPSASRTSSPAPAPTTTSSRSSASHRLRYEISLPAWEDGGLSPEEDDAAPRIRVLVTLPREYPDQAPTLQIMGRYIGNYAIEPGLFGAITRTFISSTGVPFTPGAVAVFDGLMYVQSLVEPWYRERADATAAAEVAQQAERAERAESGRGSSGQATSEQQELTSKLQRVTLALRSTRPVPPITTSDPIVDRKSSFVGHACRVQDEEDVMAVVAHLLDDKRIARAAHPTIWAYRTAREVGGAAGRVVESDYDDDGETQAGARLKHLLEVLDLTGVLVVVTRWFGGTHLGPDRFKHINQAARDALEAGGFLEEVKEARKGRRRA